MQKFLLRTVFCLSFFTINSFAQSRLSGGQAYGWIDISDNIPGTPSLSDVCFISDNEGWITSEIYFYQLKTGNYIETKKLFSKVK